MLPVFYSPAYVSAAHGFETTRKAAWIADSLAAAPIAGIEVVEPEPLTFDEVARVHAWVFVRAVETGEPRALAESQGFDWDEGLWRMVLASNGGAVAAARHALQHGGAAGSLSSGMHHARRDRGSGFCTFNGLVLAARAALDAGAHAVLILDLDAHCGGGTASLIAEEPRISQADVSVCSFDRYAPSTRASLRVVKSSEEYLPAIEEVLDDLTTAGPAFDLCLYNAGMDPHEGCSIGGLPGITSDILAARERLVFEWCASRRLPIAFALAGGYLGPWLGEEDIVELHRLTVSAGAGRGGGSLENL